MMAMVGRPPQRLLDGSGALRDAGDAFLFKASWRGARSDARRHRPARTPALRTPPFFDCVSLVEITSRPSPSLTLHQFLLKSLLYPSPSLPNAPCPVSSLLSNSPPPPLDVFFDASLFFPRNRLPQSMQSPGGVNSRQRTHQPLMAGLWFFLKYHLFTRVFSPQSCKRSQWSVKRPWPSSSIDR